MIKLSGKNYVAGKFSAVGKNTYKSINPQTSEKSKIIFTDATQKEIDTCLKKAVNAFENVSKDKIPIFLKEVSNQIMSLGDQLLNTANWETALSFDRLRNERSRTCDQLEMFADYIKNNDYLDITVDKESNIKSMKIPIGPVVVFPPSNFPFAYGVCGGDTTSAWAAGCPAIIKVHPSYPQTSELFAYAVKKAVEKHRLPPGFFSLLHGKEVDVSKKLVVHPEVRAVGFTGSLRVGRSIYDLAASRKRPIPVYAEMGSINPVFIVDYKKDTAGKLADSITVGKGQFCTKPGVIFVLEKSDDFIKQVVEKVRSKNPGILLNSKIKELLVENVDETKNTENVKVLTGGKEIKDRLSFENTIFETDSKTFLKNKNLHREHFGPVSIFVKCKDLTDFVKIIDNLDGQLTGTIHVDKDNYERVKPLFSKLKNKVGRVILNGVPTGVKVCPAMVHGGPYPATTNFSSTAVGTKAIRRFLRLVAYQNIPNELLPKEFKK